MSLDSTLVFRAALHIFLMGKAENLERKDLAAGRIIFRFKSRSVAVQAYFFESHTKMLRAVGRKVSQQSYRLMLAKNARNTRTFTAISRVSGPERMNLIRSSVARTSLLLGTKRILIFGENYIWCL